MENKEQQLKFGEKNFFESDIAKLYGSTVLYGSDFTNFENTERYPSMML